jgi:hypothetical protein
MYNIVNQCIDMQKQTTVTEKGEVVSMKPTHLLLTEEHYDNILLSIGVKREKEKTPFTELYGLKLIFTDVPLEQPRVLSMSS